MYTHTYAVLSLLFTKGWGLHFMYSHYTTTDFLIFNYFEIAVKGSLVSILHMPSIPLNGFNSFSQYSTN